MFGIDEVKIAIIGLGYVGLPLAVEFGKSRQVVGFDVNKKRILELKNGVDVNLETTEEELREARYLKFTSEIEKIKECNFYIITVPTPINTYKQPDLTPLIKASETVGTVLNRGDIVVYESTVYPGCTEEECVPILARMSGMTFNQDFYVGYSPERINPGDKPTSRKSPPVQPHRSPNLSMKYISRSSAQVHIKQRASKLLRQRR